MPTMPIVMQYNDERHSCWSRQKLSLRCLLHFHNQARNLLIACRRQLCCTTPTTSAARCSTMMGRRSGWRCPSRGSGGSFPGHSQQAVQQPCKPPWPHLELRAFNPAVLLQLLMLCHIMNRSAPIPAVCRALAHSDRRWSSCFCQMLSSSQHQLLQHASAGSFMATFLQNVLLSATIGALWSNGLNPAIIHIQQPRLLGLAPCTAAQSCT